MGSKRIINPEAPFDDMGKIRPSKAQTSLGFVLIASLIGGLVIFWILYSVLAAAARDLEGKHKNDPLASWFDSLASGKGLCCSFADGFSIQDVDWDTTQSCETGKSGGSGMPSVPICSGHYRVRLDGQWITVPDSAVVTEPNRFGPAVVWPYKDAMGVTQIRCFLPSSMS